MAKDDEFPPAPTRTAPDGQLVLPAIGCDVSGAVATAYHAPVVRFAREHFIGKEDAQLGVHDVPAANSKKLADGINIVVDPRDTVGELRIAAVGPPFYAPGHLWAEDLYCLHVLHEGTRTTIVVKASTSWIQ